MLPGYAGLRMFISPTSVIDFLLEAQHVPSLKQVVDDLAASAA